MVLLVYADSGGASANVDGTRIQASGGSGGSGGAGGTSVDTAQVGGAGAAGASGEAGYVSINLTS